MLSSDPVSTRKYLRVLESKTWRSALLTPADNLFTVDRLGRFPSSKWFGTCRVGDRILHVHQTSSGTCTTPVEVAMSDLTWYFYRRVPFGSCLGHDGVQKTCGRYLLHLLAIRL